MIAWYVAASQLIQIQSIIGTIGSIVFAYFLIEIYKIVKLDQGRVITSFNQKILGLVTGSIGLQFCYYFLYPFSIIPYVLDWFWVVQILIYIKDYQKT
jgi:hypothetical protein